MIFDYLFGLLFDFVRWLTLSGSGMLWYGAGLAALLCLPFYRGGIWALREKPIDRLARSLLAGFAVLAGCVVTRLPLRSEGFDLAAIQQSIESAARFGTMVPLSGAVFLALALALTYPRRLRAMALGPFSMVKRCLWVAGIWIVVMAIFFCQAKPYGPSGGAGSADAHGKAGASESIPVPSEIVFEPVPDQSEMAERADAIVIRFEAAPESVLSRRAGQPVARSLVCVVEDQLFGLSTTVEATNLELFLKRLEVTLVAAIGKRSKPPLGVGVLTAPYPGDYALERIVRTASGILPLLEDGTRDRAEEFPHEAALSEWLLALREETAARE